MTASPYHDPTAVGGRRMLAALIDFAVFVLAGWIVFRIMAERIGGEVAAAGCSVYQEEQGGLNLCIGIRDDMYLVSGAKAGLYMGIVLLLWFLYHGLAQSTVGTIGKLLLGLRVVDRAGAPASQAQCLLRSVTLAVGWLVVIVGFFVAALVGAILILGGRDHQRVGDRWAKTFVVRTRDVGRPPSQIRGSGPGGFSQGVPPPPPPPVTDR